jgi:hypothetical protein
MDYRHLLLNDALLLCAFAGFWWGLRERVQACLERDARRAMQQVLERHAADMRRIDRVQEGFRTLRVEVAELRALVTEAREALQHLLEATRA